MSHVLGHLEMSQNLSSNLQQTDCSQCQSINRSIKSKTQSYNFACWEFIFSDFFCLLKVNVFFFKKIFQEHYQSVKQLGSRFCLFDVTLDVPADNFSVMSGWVSPPGSSWIKPVLSNGLNFVFSKHGPQIIKLFYAKLN